LKCLSFLRCGRPCGRRTPGGGSVLARSGSSSWCSSWPPGRVRDEWAAWQAGSAQQSGRSGRGWRNLLFLPRGTSWDGPSSWRLTSLPVFSTFPTGSWRSTWVTMRPAPFAACQSGLRAFPWICSSNPVLFRSLLRLSEPGWRPLASPRPEEPGRSPARAFRMPPSTRAGVRHPSPRWPPTDGGRR
jgi:hypothetical protein